MAQGTRIVYLEGMKLNEGAVPFGEVNKMGTKRAVDKMPKCPFLGPCAFNAQQISAARLLPGGLKPPLAITARH